jgi:hypothetical protein
MGAVRNATNAMRKENIRQVLLTANGRRRISSMAELWSPERTSSEESGGGEALETVPSEVRSGEERMEKMGRGANHRTLNRERVVVGRKPLSPRRFVGLVATWS